MKNQIKDTLTKLFSSGKFTSEHNRVWTMCQVALRMATYAIEEAERCNLTDKQFYINFQDALNILSVKEPHSDEQYEDFKNEVEKFYADSGD